MRTKRLYTVCVTIGSARVPRMDFYGLADPFVTLSVVVPTGVTSAASIPTTVRTRTLKRVVTPVWNESFEFGVSPAEDVLVLKVFDEDTIKDDLIGLALLPVRHIPITRAASAASPAERDARGGGGPSYHSPAGLPHAPGGGRSKHSAAAAALRPRPAPVGGSDSDVGPPPLPPLPVGSASSAATASGTPGASDSPVQPGLHHQQASRDSPPPPRVIHTTLELFKPRKRGVVDGLGRLTVAASVREEVVELLEESDLAAIGARGTAYGGAGGGGVGGRRPEVLEKRFLGIGELALFLWANEGHSRGLRANWQVRVGRGRRGGGMAAAATVTRLAVVAGGRWWGGRAAAPGSTRASRARCAVVLISSPLLQRPLSCPLVFFCSHWWALCSRILLTIPTVGSQQADRAAGVPAVGGDGQQGRRRQPVRSPRAGAA